MLKSILQNIIFYYYKMLIIIEVPVSRGQNQKKYWCLNGIWGETYPHKYVYLSALF